MNTDEFQHIAPYEDEEIPAAIQRVLDNPLLAVVARKLNPDEDIERVRSRTAAITTADDYQRMVMFPLLMHVLNTTSAGLTTEGFELLERDKSYLFVSNHRDISLDAALFTMQLLRHNLPACEIAFGDNLLANSLVAELARINRMFPILRGGTRKELYMVTLRGERMYDFIQKLICIVLPRIRDFRGISSKSFDGRGNYTLGLKEQALFPEISYDEVETVLGMNISIITTAQTDEEARAMLKYLGLPFKK